MTRKQRKAASTSAKLRIAEELEIIREKLAYAGNIYNSLLMKPSVTIPNLVIFVKMHLQLFLKMKYS
ncbi:hypothetical protein J4727_00640 [Providencia rettgeri]|uniref:Uncharacterized protein n=1 Tax=Providencia rettgeri TaxID=587 RepID=A0A939NDQ8_PRORE|nr:hypothetical protein [Providencia rettgeri]